MEKPLPRPPLAMPDSHCGRSLMFYLRTQVFTTALPSCLRVSSSHGPLRKYSETCQQSDNKCIQRERLFSVACVCVEYRWIPGGRCNTTVNTPVMRENRDGGWVVGWEERTFYSLPSSHMYEGKVRRSGEALAVLSGIDCREQLQRFLCLHLLHELFTSIKGKNFLSLSEYLHQECDFTLEH